MAKCGAGGCGAGECGVGMQRGCHEEGLVVSGGGTDAKKAGEMSAFRNTRAVQRSRIAGYFRMRFVFEIICEVEIGLFWKSIDFVGENGFGC